MTLDEACKRVGFSKDSYYRAKEVEEKGVPDLIRAMDSQKLSVIAAKQLAQATPEEQEECLTKRIDEGRATARTIGKHLRRIRNQKDREETLARAVQSVDKDDSIQIHHCPFQKLEHHADLKPESVQLICTDIPFGNEFVDQIGELATVSERVLVAGGLFVAYLGQHRFNEKLGALDEHLKFQWLNSATWYGKENDVRHLKLVSRSSPIVIYSKGRWTPRYMWSDTYITKHEAGKKWHPWERPLEVVEKLVDYFSKPGDLVVDPCGGGFTTAIACLRNHRRFIGCDIDKAAVVKGQERLAEEQNGQVSLPLKKIRVNSA